MPPPDLENISGAPIGGGQVQTLRPLTRDLITSVLDAHGYAYQTDTDGDPVGRWNDNLIYFLRLGATGELLQIRTIAATTFDIDDVLKLYAFCNAWNHDRLWPKAFVHVSDDGGVRICGEVVVDLGRGVTSEQLDQLINCGISTGCQLSDAAADLRS